MTLPYEEPLTVRRPGPRVLPEPPRRGEPSGEPCGICSGQSSQAVWADALWSLHPPVGGSLPGTVWLASRTHADSFRDLPPDALSDFGAIAAAVERAIYTLGDVGRVHLYRWGDGGAHFHVWFLPRPLGMLEARNMMLPLWEDVLPNVSDEKLRDAAAAVALALEKRPLRWAGRKDHRWPTCLGAPIGALSSTASAFDGWSISPRRRHLDAGRDVHPMRSPHGQRGSLACRGTALPSASCLTAWSTMPS